MIRPYILSLAIALAAVCVMHAQPLAAPYTFAFDNAVEIDTSLMTGFIAPAGSHGRLKLNTNGNLEFADGTRFRVVGVNLQWGACFPDSAMAIAMARRFRALGINTVRFTTIDVTWWIGGSIFADGTTTGPLDPRQMRLLDWFVYQLKQHGVYSAFTFHSVWRPRADDGVRAPDSTGWGTRMPLIFDPVVQRIHRNIIKSLLNHVNQFTNVAYKDEHAIPFIIAADDASLTAYWLYSQDVVRPSQYGVKSTGDLHVRLIDSSYNAWLRGKGLTTDVQLNARWAKSSSSTTNQLENAGFEDPFSSAWFLGVNSNDGAQAVMLYSDADKHEGTQSMRVRINKLDASRNAFGVYLRQVATKLKRLQRYTLSFWARTTPDRGSRGLYLYAYNSVFPSESYGLSTSLTIDTQWKQYTFSFTCSGGDSTTGMILFGMGSDSGDVFLDDMHLTEAGFPGVYPGESIANNSIVRATFWTDALSPNRSKDEAAFYSEKLENLFTNIRKLVRDTIQSDVLMCPSSRMYSFFDLHAARDYDIFSATDWRSSRRSMLMETGGGPMTGFASSRPAGKAFVLMHAAISNIAPPVPSEGQTVTLLNAHQSEMGVTLPAYLGLQDWDGIFMGTWASVAVAGRATADSAAAWEIVDKPSVLAMLPSVSRAMQERVVQPSLRQILITNTAEALQYPRIHLNRSYSITTGVDGRMPLFRRVAMETTPAPSESVLPHLEIGALAGTIDLTNLNAENEQIFWNATTATLKVQTDRYVAVTGPLANQLIQMPGLIFEETSQSRHTSIVLNSLTDKPLFETSSALLTISTRSFNTDVTCSPTSLALLKFGTGPTQMEGSAVRITYTAPAFDTMYVQPLGADALPRGNAIVATRGTGGKFSVTVNTTQNATPLYRMELRAVISNVDEGITERELVLAPNPADNLAALYHGENVTSIDVVSMTGELLYTIGNIESTRTDLPLHTLASGVYMVRVISKHGIRQTTLNVVR